MVGQSLSIVGFPNAISLLDTYLGRASDLRPWLAGAQINRDIDLRLQYLAGMGASHYSEGAIYREMLSHRTYPEKLLVALPESAHELKRRFFPQDAAKVTP